MQSVIRPIVTIVVSTFSASQFGMAPILGLYGYAGWRLAVACACAMLLHCIYFVVRSIFSHSDRVFDAAYRASHVHTKCQGTCHACMDARAARTDEYGASTQEGDFRTSHTRIREFGESVAFYGGQAKERLQSDTQFQGAYDVSWLVECGFGASPRAASDLYVVDHEGALAGQLPAPPVGVWVNISRWYVTAAAMPWCDESTFEQYSCSTQILRSMEWSGSKLFHRTA